jgi:uncharacterized protein YaaQ
MFSKFFAFLFSVEQEVVHDVEAIIADFTDTVTKLEAAAVAKAKQAEDHILVSVHAEALADAAFAAAEKATAVAAKIKALVA